MPNNINVWNNAKGTNLYDAFQDEGLSSIDNNHGYLNIELNESHHIQYVLDLLGVSMFSNTDMFLHGFGGVSYNENSYEETNDTAASFFENGLRFGSTSARGNILGTASLQKTDDMYSNKIYNYNGMGNSVVIINIPHHYRDIHMGAALRTSPRGDSLEEQTASHEHVKSIALDGIGLDAIPKEFIVGIYFRDVNKPEAPAGRLILNPNYIGFENNLQVTPEGEISNYDALKNTITNAPNYQGNIVFSAPESDIAANANTEEARIDMAFDGMNMEIQALSQLLADNNFSSEESLDIDNM